MDKKFIDQLVKVSYINRKIDEKRINDITKRLKRSQLKRYIKALKAKEYEQTVFIETSSKEKELVKEKMKMLFPDKKIIVTYNPSLLAGIKITKNDMIYEMNLQNMLSSLTSFMES